LKKFRNIQVILGHSASVANVLATRTIVALKICFSCRLQPYTFRNLQNKICKSGTYHIFVISGSVFIGRL